jgi:hypothetical protein
MGVSLLGGSPRVRRGSAQDRNSCMQTGGLGRLTPMKRVVRLTFTKAQPFLPFPVEGAALPWLNKAASRLQCEWRSCNESS